MRNFFKITTMILISFLFSFLGFAAYHEPEKTRMEDVKKEISETYDVMKDYTLEQRDEAISAAENKLKQLDSEIEAMDQKIEQGWESMSSKARQETRQSLRSLRQQREKLAEWYGGMVHSSAEAWDEVKRGFADSYDRLKKSVSKAVQEYDSNK